MADVPHPFIVLEGLSGVGKTAVGQALARTLNGVLYKTPPAPFTLIRDEVDRTCDLEARFFFYLAGVLHASSEIAALLQERPVVCDRYILTTECYHRSLGLTAHLEYHTLHLLQPTLTVLLTCEESERQRRLNSRGRSYNDIQEEILGLDQIFESEYRKHGIYEIDNTSPTIEATVRKILNLLKLGT